MKTLNEILKDAGIKTIYPENKKSRCLVRIW